MPQRTLPRTMLTRTFALCAVAAVTLTAQIGIQLPGMGRRSPGGNNSGRQQGTQKKTDNGIPNGPVETLTGSLLEISGTSLTIDTGEDHLVLVQISQGTKYLSTMDKVKASDFEAGDHVTVEAVKDSDDHYHSKTLTMNKKGTAEDKAAAMKAASSSASTGGSSGSGSDDPNRPKLRRADSDSGTITSAPKSSPGPVASASNSASDDTDRPRLRRGDSGSSDPAPAPRPTPATAASTTPTSRSTSQPVVITGSDSVGSSTVSQSAGRRPAVYGPADSAPSVATNSDRPVLARAPSASASDTPINSSGRPTLSATDDNGVTRLPPIEAPDRVATGDRQYNTGGGDPVIEHARDEGLSFSETLPNYVVKRVTNRFQTGGGGGRGGRTGWQALDVVTADLTYLDGKENYTNILVNGRATRSIEQTGSWSEGEFGSMLQAILSPMTNADFRNQKATMIGSRATYRYDYTVTQPRSTWTLHADGQTFTPGYTGSIWVDKATYRVLRIEIAARDLPRNFPLDTAESSIDYDFVMIAEQKVLLPTHAEALSCTRGTADCTRNVTDFRNYRKYGADTSITFEGEK